MKGPRLTWDWQAISSVCWEPSIIFNRSALWLPSSQWPMVPRIPVSELQPFGRYRTCQFPIHVWNNLFQTERAQFAFGLQSVLVLDGICHRLTLLNICHCFNTMWRKKVALHTDQEEFVTTSMHRSPEFKGSEDFNYFSAIKGLSACLIFFSGLFELDLCWEYCTWHGCMELRKRYRNANIN